MKIEDVEASVARHLYENLQKTHGIKVFEDIISEDFENYSEWLVIESLTNSLGIGPVQHYFLHIAIQKSSPNPKQKLNVLTDKVISAMDQGTEITLYSYSTKELLGYMTVSDVTLSPVIQHRSGGSMRSLAVSVVYEG